MFNFKNIVDTAVKASKTPLTYVDDKGIRANLENLIDSYANFTKTVYDTNLELAKQVAERTQTIDFIKAFDKSTATK
jgi:hypothetical protein